MATYEYKCPDCYVEIEVHRSILDEEEIPQCYNCDATMKKVFGAPSINLVGRGFYRNGG